jgi:hypothetical protein
MDTPPAIRIATEASAARTMKKKIPDMSASSHPGGE